MVVNLVAQEKKKGQAFREHKDFKVPLLFPSQADLQVLEAFAVLQKANSGDANAQHELGLRYLTGKGFASDTLKAAYWIKKSAEQGLPLAQYNYAILLLNGYGVDWNPFDAFKYFSFASSHNIPEALYMMGIMHIENFVVPRNYKKAYQYLSKSAELGFEPANYTLRKIKEYGLDIEEKIDTSKVTNSPNDTVFNLMFLDFDNDTSLAVNDSSLAGKVDELFKNVVKNQSSQSEKDLVGNYSMDSIAPFLQQAANAGIPEALCLLGQCYEVGNFFHRDPVLACANYLRAFHLDSYKAPMLISRLVGSEKFISELEVRASNKEPDALYVLAGLNLTGFLKVLVESQSIELLEQCAKNGHIPSMLELGSYYFTGRWVNKDTNKTNELWSNAILNGSVEARIRLAAANVLGQIHTMSLDTALALVREWADKGSLLSALTLAYCYENGLNMRQDKGEAYRIYRGAFSRGSQSAYYAIRRMHDQIRPDSKEFKMTD